MKKYFIFFLIILVIFGFLLPSFAFLENNAIPPPKNLEETKTIGEKFLKALSQSLKIGQQWVLTIWQKIAKKTKDCWNTYIGPKIQTLWQKIKAFFEKEVETRKPEIKEEFKKEKQEMKEEIPKVSKSLWQRLKELIK